MPRNLAEQPGNPLEDAAATTLAAELLKQARDELKRADAKASTLLAGALVAVGFALSRGQSPALRLALLPVLAWLAVLAVAGGIGLLCACIYPAGSPRKERVSRHLVGFHGQVSAHATLAELELTLRHRAAVPVLHRVAGNLYIVSRLAQRKYRLLRLAIVSFTAAALLAAMSLLLGLVGVGR